MRLEADNYQIYNEKFKNYSLRDSVYNYEFSKNINIDKNIKEHNIKLERLEQENIRLQQIEEQKRIEEKRKLDEELRLYLEKKHKELQFQKEKIEQERKAQSEIKNKIIDKRKILGLWILVIAFFVAITVDGIGLQGWIAFMPLWAIGYLFTEI